MTTYEPRELLYENPLSAPADIEDWALEGEAVVTFPRDRMRMENAIDPEEAEGTDVEPHYVHWCPERFPDEIRIGWDFWPLNEPGLSMLFFAATGRDGEHVLDPDLPDRTGAYSDYMDGEIDTLHASYFRRNHHGSPKKEIEFQTINLRKSKGFHLCERGGDPIPCVKDANPPYRIEVVKHGPDVSFSVDGLEVLNWTDDGESYGPIREGGSIGFRQMAGTIGEYANLTVHAVEKVD